MKRMLWMVVISMLLTFSTAVQVAAEDDDTDEVTVSIFHVATGKHLAFLEWQAAREAINEQLGLTPTEWYVHLDGASWDFISISADTTDEEDDKLDQALAKKGLTTGFKAALEFRTFVAAHTDTEARRTTMRKLLAAAK